MAERMECAALYRAEGQVWISPTRLAAALAGSGTAPEATHGCVIVETNYRGARCISRLPY